MSNVSFADRESVIRAILRREQDGLPLNDYAVRQSCRPLHSAARRLFGRWRVALEAAGIKVGQIKRCRQWNEEKIVGSLRTRFRRGLSLRPKIINRTDSGLYRAGCLFFGSWCNALMAAKINPEHICRLAPWDQSKIIEAILLRVVRGESLGSTTVRPRKLKSAAVKEFGSWSAALAAAGLEPKQYIGQSTAEQINGKRQEWSKERVRKAILQRHALGQSLGGMSVRRDNHALYNAGRTWFGNWQEALTQVGLDPQSKRKDE